MNTAVARRQGEVDWEPVPIRDDSQLQNLLQNGWTIVKEGVREIKLTKENGGRTKSMTHHRRRAK
jgi:hypothetical protein